MSTRQKSFFDQNHTSSKVRPQWQRNRNGYIPPRDGGAEVKPPPIPPAIPVSSQTKSKLKAFEFRDSGLGHGSNLSKENCEMSIHHTVGQENERDGLVSTQRLGDGKAVSKLPQTPAARIPLAELIGNINEDPTLQVPQEISPEERVYWKHRRSPNSSGTRASRSTLGHAAARGTKRARSSSPLPVSYELALDTVAESDTLDLQTLQKSLKTPQADPVLELWNRYSMKSMNKQMNQGPQLPIFSQLVSSSPRVNANGSPGGAGLRRSLSCGIDWPTSKTKRRKVVGVHIFEDCGDRVQSQKHKWPEAQHTSKLSRVSLLVERIQESFTKSAGKDTVATGPSSSSPLPARHPDPTDTILSPLREKTALRRKGAMDRNVDNPPSAAPGNETPQKSSDSSSDFGEIDLDNIDLSMLEGTNVAASCGDVNMPNPKLPADLEVEQAIDPAPEDDVNRPLKNATTADSDDFDDGDEDLYAADLEEVMARYDDHTSSREDGRERAAVEEASCIGQKTVTASREDSALDNDDEDDEDFGDICDMDFEVAVAQMSSKQEQAQAGSATAASHLNNSNTKGITQRYLITAVIESVYTTAQGHKRPEKVLIVTDENTQLSRPVLLRQSWFTTRCSSGDHVHIIGDGTTNQTIIIDDKSSNLLILHPDYLLSSTVLADSFTCMRRAVLQDRVKATSEANQAQIYGHILHEVFQEALKANKWDGGWLGEVIETVVKKRHVEDIYQIDMDVDQVIVELKDKMGMFQSWAKIFVGGEPRAEAVVRDRNGGPKSLISINKLLEVEEHIWSPTYGLKGNIDATVQMTVQEEDKKKTVIVPLELKTGRNTSSISHRAQTALYTLLLTERYDVNVASGLLYYMETSSMTRIPAMRNEIRHMIIQRNELACYLRDRQSQLPSMLENPHMCGKCYAKVPCFIYHKLIDDGNGQTSGLGSQFEDIVNHLKPSHREFLRHWDDLLSKEESDMMKHRRELWTMTSKQREKLGRCFSNVIIEGGSEHEDMDAPKINRFRYTFIKNTSPPGFSFVDSQLAVGEPIVVSDEKGHFALANGFVTQVTKRRIWVSVDRRLHDEARVRRRGFDEVNNQVFKSVVIEVSKEDDGDDYEDDRQTGNRDPVLYRLDKDEFNNGMATARNNLIRLMTDEGERTERLRSLIVDEKSPSFKAPNFTSSNTSSTTNFDEMNCDQRAAIEKVLSAEDYSLILGMPGTGKTTTIVQIIRTLVQRGKTVLLTSYTHSAVDNILLKLRPFLSSTTTNSSDNDMNILRLGSLSRIHPEVRTFATCLSTTTNPTSASSISDLHKIYSSANIVATTCLGITHPFFQPPSSNKAQKRKPFDYLIIDESSQITLPVCLGPLYHARRFILVGDHNQLPPLVQNPAARRGGLDVSLFKLLCSRHPEAVVQLSVQYRMCEEVMLLSNTLIYKGELKCADERIARRALAVDMAPLMKLKKGGPHHHHDRWLQNLIDPSVKACFVNTDTLGLKAREEAKGSRIVNRAEVEIVGRIVDALILCGVSPKEVGVITVYRSQLALLQQRIRRQRQRRQSSSVKSMNNYDNDANDADANAARKEEEERLNNDNNTSSSDSEGGNKNNNDDTNINNNNSDELIELHTPDRFQGRDKEVIILSLVRSNPSRHLGDLLQDWRRINVAFTRARTKLLVVGSKDTLSGNALLSDFLHLMYAKKGWALDLPADALLACGEEDIMMADVDEDEEENKGSRGGKNMQPSPSRTRSSPRWPRSRLGGKENSRSPKRRGRVSDRFFGRSLVGDRGW